MALKMTADSNIIVENNPVWHSVDKELPPHSEPVLCWYEYFRYGGYNCMYQDYGIGYCINGVWGGEVSNGRRTMVLAWTELPEPPKCGEV